ncbi:MAG: hypothetical protein ACXW4B_11735 [Micavibrio sp.]
MYGFQKSSYPSLKDAALDAVRRIYEAGLMFREGKLAPGGNNVMADNAARPFTPEDLQTLLASEDRLDHGLAQVISLRQDYMKGKGESCLKEIYEVVRDLAPLGFTPRALTSVGTSRPSPSANGDPTNIDRVQLSALGDQFRRAADGAAPPAAPVQSQADLQGLRDLGRYLNGG